MQSSDYTPWLSSKRTVNLCPQKNLHIDTYCSFIYNCQNLEAIKMSFSRWMDKLWFIHIVEYYLTPKRNELSSYEKIWRKLFNAYYQLKEANLKKLHTYDSSYMTFQKVQNNRELKISGCQGLVGREEWIGRTQKIFRAVKPHCTILQWWVNATIPVCTLVKIHKMHNSKNEP